MVRDRVRGRVEYEEVVRKDEEMQGIERNEGIKESKYNRCYKMIKGEWCRDIR